MGQSTISENLMYIPRLLFMIVAVIVIVVFVGFFSKLSVETQQVESEVLFYKIFYTVGGITYQDPATGSYYSHTIDLEKFKSETLEKALNYPKDRYASARLTLFDTKMKQIKPPIFYKEVWYNRWKPLVGAVIKGPEGANEFKRIVPITYKDGEDYKPGMLEVSIILPNSK
jgi:hypothetical protein